jgi:hypothetical protein
VTRASLRIAIAVSKTTGVDVHYADGQLATRENAERMNAGNDISIQL